MNIGRDCITCIDRTDKSDLPLTNRQPELAAITNCPEGGQRVLGRPEFGKAHHYPWVKRGWNVLLACGFLVFIVSPLVAWWSHGEGDPSLNENRHLAPMPTVSWERERLVRLPGQIEAYCRDHFGYREYLIHIFSVIRYKWLGVSTDDVVIGKNNWLFYEREGSIENFLGLRPLTGTDLQVWGNFLEKRRANLAARRTRYFFVIAPDKTSIYPEMLPSYIQSRRGRTRVDQLVQYLKETKAKVKVLDLRGPLVRAKPDGLVYFQNDTHWNGRGFYVAYQELMKEMGRWLPGLQALMLHQELVMTAKQSGGGDWSLLGLPDENLSFPADFLLRDGSDQSQHKAVILPPIFPETPNPWGEPMMTVREDRRYSLLIFHDSFLRTGMRQWEDTPFADSFRKVVLVTAKPSLAQMLAEVDQEHPDVVVEEWAERSIGTPPVIYMQ